MAPHNPHNPRRRIEQLARPIVLDALLARQNLNPSGECSKIPLLAPDLAPAGRNLRELETLWRLAWSVASLLVFDTARLTHGEPLVHKVLLLILAVPIPEFDLLAFHAEPPEVIPMAGEGRHSADLLFPGHAVQAYCGHLVTGGRTVDICIGEETDLGAVERHLDGIPGS